MADTEKDVGIYNLRVRFRDGDPLDTNPFAKGYFPYVSLGPVTPLGHVRKTITSSAQSLTDLAGFPTGIKQLDIFNLDADNFVYFTDLTGQTPSSSLGFPIPPQAWFRYDNDVVNADFKLWTPATAILAFACYG